MGSAGGRWRPPDRSAAARQNTATLADGGEEGGHRGRRPFVHVRGPEVERHQRQFERQTDQHHAHANLRQHARQTIGGQLCTDTGEAQVARLGIQQRHAEQQKMPSLRRTAPCT